MLPWSLCSIVFTVAVIYINSFALFKCILFLRVCVAIANEFARLILLSPFNIDV
jgi:hypothetical protein